ncbi:restriction endonuclease subunit S [Xenorhabdus littoralis]|uniref:restriction endonuclease subunit S n=1 Tax=Xenorhabdus littoralis TaxID=2582835 RepID=UPI0029E804E0|nr:restriction endonuclease subunit S [Xenorhabdus sp. psl]MDX7992771.1 restriction endonuclease subunit S [Xenorhabdus sp. psl]
MANKWINTTVGEFCPFIYGKNLPQDKRIIGTIPVFGSNGCVDYHNNAYVKGPGIIIGRKGSVGAINISYIPFWPIDTTFYIEKPSHGELFFTYYLLKTLGLEGMNSDSAVPGLNRDNAHSLPIKIPKEIKEQCKIGLWIHTFDRKISINRAINQTLEQISQTLFKSWFVDFDPVIDNALEAGNPIPDSLQKQAELRQKVRNSSEFKPLSNEIRALFPAEFEETELGWVPKGWECLPVSKTIEINPSVKLSKGQNAKYIDMKALPTSGYSISEVITKPFSGGTKFQKNDVLFARITPCLENGKTGFVDFLNKGEIGFGSTEFIVMRATDKVHFGYVACLARDEKLRSHAIQNMVGSSGRQRVQNSCFDNYYVAIPDANIMSIFAVQMEILFSKMRCNNNEISSLTQLRDTLLPKLISGELSLEELPETTTETEYA